MSRKISNLRGVILPLSAVFTGQGVGQILNHRIILGVIFISVGYVLLLTLATFGQRN